MMAGQESASLAADGQLNRFLGWTLLLFLVGALAVGLVGVLWLQPTILLAIASCVLGVLWWVIALKSLARATWIYIYLLPFIHASVTITLGPLELQIYYLLGALLLLRWVLFPPHNGRLLIPRSATRWAAIILPAVMVLAGLAASNLAYGIAEAAKWIFNFGMLYLVASQVRRMDPASLRRFLKGWFLSLAIVVGLALLIFVSPFDYLPAARVDFVGGIHFALYEHVWKLRYDGVNTWASLALGLGNNYDMIAGMSMLAILLGLGLLGSEPGRRAKLFLASLILILVLALGLTYTRSAWLGLAAGLALIAVWTSSRWKGKLWVAGIVLVIAAGSLLLAPVRERIAITFAQTSSNRDSRLLFWQLLFDQVKHHPVLGIGPRNAAELITNAAREIGQLGVGETSTAAHNPFLTLWAEAGTFALLALLWLVGVSFANVYSVTHRLRKMRLPLSNLTASVGAAYLAWNTFVFFNPQLTMWFWVLSGICIGMVARSVGEGLRPRAAANTLATSTLAE